MYNTVDAALLFLDVVYEYYLETGDLEFVREAFPVMEDIVFWYQKERISILKWTVTG